MSLENMLSCLLLVVCAMSSLLRRVVGSSVVVCVSVCVCVCVCVARLLLPLCRASECLVLLFLLLNVVCFTIWYVWLLCDSHLCLCLCLSPVILYAVQCCLYMFECLRILSLQGLRSITCWKTRWSARCGGTSMQRRQATRH